MSSQKKRTGPHLPKRYVNGVKISGQEHLVLRLIGKGFRSKQIAKELSILPSSVSAVKTELKKKLKIGSHVDLTIYATRELIKQEIKDGDFLRDDLLAEWIHYHINMYGLISVIS